MEYRELREKYNSFIYENYNISEDDDNLYLSYDFKIDGLSEFHPKWVFKKPEKTRFSEDNLFKNLVFNLGMVELVSYWKICCPKNVIVKCGFLDDFQVKWWKDQYFNGLGEFFYTNKIEADFSDFMEIISLGNNLSFSENIKSMEGCLVPVGGGKDSVVSIELLKKLNYDNSLYIINPRKATLDTAKASGIDDEKWVISKRTLDGNMLSLNKQGYLNGHTPFSAIVAFSAMINAYIYKNKYIVLSNESSANESTVLDCYVNHQYSKSFKFEKDFNEYTNKYLKTNISYFSLLRPLSEYQIAKYFSKCKDYHKLFRSCNVGSKTDIWCCHCSKCLFVYIILSPFLSPERLIEIFGVDMLNDNEMLEIFKKLIGIIPEKPFECVGSRDEVNMAIIKALSQFYKNDNDLPVLYKYYKSTEIYKEYKEKENPYENYFDNENLLPKDFLEIMRKEF